MWDFDWYSATIREDSVGGPHGERVAEALAGRLSGFLDEGPALHGYGEGRIVRSFDGDTLARCMFGGKQSWPLVVASGARTTETVGVLRELWPASHWVTRVDSALDFDEPGIFERLYHDALTFADERGLKVSMAGDWHRAKDGRTLYVGSMSSAVFVRIYEKGLEMRSKGVEDAPLDWVRVELSAKPQKASRVRTAALSASEVWGLSKWARAFRVAVVDGIEVPPALMQQHRESDLQRSLRFMEKQYGPTILEQVRVLGGWEEFAEYWERRLTHG